MASFTEKRESYTVIVDRERIVTGGNFLVLTKETLEHSKTFTPMKQETKEFIFFAWSC